MEATKSSNHEGAVYTSKAGRLLKSSVVYGANASGKSNLIKAMYFALHLAVYSINNEIKAQINTTPFLLSTDTDGEGSLFEFEFIISKKIYRYGFVINKQFIMEEWLYIKPNNDSEFIPLFTRNKQDITVIDRVIFKEGLETIAKTRENVLFLSKVADDNGEISKTIVEFFVTKFVFFTTIGFDRSIGTLLRTQVDIHNIIFTEKYNLFIEALKCADIGIKGILRREMTIDEYPPHMRIHLESGKIKPLTRIKTTHTKYDASKQAIGEVEFDLSNNESTGTQHLVGIFPWILKILDEGGILIVDEFEEHLHPLMVKFILDIFNSNEHNPNGAQLIFNTHNLFILDKDIFREDQIWFTDKDKFGATDLYSLVDFELPQEFNLVKFYLNGKFGGIPSIKNFIANMHSN
ncbi:MAG TPA: ATP-binding protein [Aquella sp.]|nr:ATP-binding protein [Aquella sp.]